MDLFLDIIFRFALMLKKKSQIPKKTLRAYRKFCPASIQYKLYLCLLILSFELDESSLKLGRV